MKEGEENNVSHQTTIHLPICVVSLEHIQRSASNTTKKKASV